MAIAKPDFDLEAAHRYFAPTAFNLAWTFLDKPERTAEDADRLLEASYASLWHWRQRADCNPAKLAIGYWQLSRIYAVLGRAADAERYGQLSLASANDDGQPFLRGYAYEALARASAVAGDSRAYRERLEQAQQWASRIEEADEKKGLEDDLASISLAPTAGRG
jgi:hypothetical protein